MSTASDWADLARKYKPRRLELGNVILEIDDDGDCIATNGAGGGFVLKSAQALALGEWLLRVFSETREEERGMSKASELAKAAMWSQEKGNAYGPVVMRVAVNGGLDVGATWAQSLTAGEALSLGRWLVDTYGEPEQCCCKRGTGK